MKNVWPLVSGIVVLCTSLAGAAPPPPSSSHPRLFMSAGNQAAFIRNAATPGTAAATLVAACQDTIDNAKDYTTRGGTDGNNWPGSAVACAFAYRATQNAQYLTQAIKYWQASLDDDQTIGDRPGLRRRCQHQLAVVERQPAGAAGDPHGHPRHRLSDALVRARHRAHLRLALQRARRRRSGCSSQTRICLSAWSDYYTDDGLSPRRGRRQLQRRLRDRQDAQRHRHRQRRRRRRPLVERHRRHAVPQAAGRPTGCTGIERSDRHAGRRHGGRRLARRLAVWSAQRARVRRRDSRARGERRAAAGDGRVGLPASPFATSTAPCRRSTGSGWAATSTARWSIKLRR